MSFKGLKYCVVGSGFFGAVVAEQLASMRNEKVLVIERRNHIGGNSHSKIDPSTGIEIHSYGTHIFHTQNKEVWTYVNKFSDFTPYQHKVLTEYRGRVYPMPISLATINQFYGMNLKPREVATFLEKERAAMKGKLPQNLEEKAISLIGEPLYRAFIRGYTMKQWAQDPKELPEDIITRLPVRDTYNTNYFNDAFQGLPKDGYGKLFENILAHPNIEIQLNVDFLDIRNEIPPECKILYTGPIDEYFGYELGALDWRSIRLEREVIQQRDFQGTSVMNYADEEVPFTRIHEYKHLHPERSQVFSSDLTVIEREYPETRIGNSKECYYPVNTDRNQKLFELYANKMRMQRNIAFGGRLGSYKYWDMDVAIASALKFVMEDWK